MVFKRSVALLALAATVAAAANVEVETALKHPVVKEVKRENGQVRIVLQEGAVVKKHKKHHHHAEVKKPEVKKPVVKKPEVKKQEVKKPAVKHHHHAEVKKVEAPKKVVHKVQEEKKDGEIIRKYAHGTVRIAAKNQPEQPKEQSKKKVVHKHAKQITEEPAGSTEGDIVDEKDVELLEGETLALNFEGHDLNVTVLNNGSIAVVANGKTTILPPSDDITLDFDGDFDLEEESSSASGSGSVSGDVGTVPQPSSLLETVEGDISSVAKKFTELASKMTGDSKLFSKDAAPVVFVCGVLGALAAVVGIAAIAVGRARDNAAAADPASVLAEATEDVDVEANATSEDNSEEEEDAAADDSESLDDSESENEDEEGKFTNEVATV
ncbi:hypothetical protein Poli38472_002363 [Pythium oligandrum]|uniref:Uncharacterized protein n=1 Tax=Pythium oligandrum TaxID=41045 RepID=A0A8K1FL29_PYTOL|nr:hypothetical protein Poli38472_002363 [Pythium oligandrum]|eukprot:TMW63422.1 hypothetical protein Poli38472_002363 [Pythium oligandrum]